MGGIGFRWDILARIELDGIVAGILTFIQPLGGKGSPEEWQANEGDNGVELHREMDLNSRLSKLFTPLLEEKLGKREKRQQTTPRLAAVTRFLDGKILAPIVADAVVFNHFCFQPISPRTCPFWRSG